MTTQQKTPMQYLEKIRDEYLQLRSQLEETDGELARLRKQRQATQTMATEAGQQWRELFKESRGQRTDRIAELQAEERTLNAELEPLAEMITALEGEVMQLRSKVAPTRQAYLNNIARTRADLDHQHVQEMGSTLFGSEDGQAFLAALSRRLDRVPSEVKSDDVFMSVGLGYGYSADPKSSMVMLNDEQKLVDAEVKRRQAQLVMDTLSQYLPKAGATSAQLPEILTPIEELPCERQSRQEQRAMTPMGRLSMELDRANPNRAAYAGAR
jgi:prefoldin subunit 5